MSGLCFAAFLDQAVAKSINWLNNHLGTLVASLSDEDSLKGCL